MKKSQLWFMAEGVFCGLIQIAVFEFFASTYYDSLPWLRAVVPVCGVAFSAVGFFFLMRRYPGIKVPKFVLGAFAYAVTFPAWTVYRAAFRLALFPQRVLAEGEGTGIFRLLGWYALGIVVTRAVILLCFIIRKQRRKKQKAQKSN